MKCCVVSVFIPLLLNKSKFYQQFIIANFSMTIYCFIYFCPEGSMLIYLNNYLGPLLKSKCHAYLYAVSVLSTNMFPVETCFEFLVSTI